MVRVATNLMMRCASGARELPKVQPLVLYLFGDAAEWSPTGTLRWEGGQAGASGPLTAREKGVLRYRRWAGITRTLRMRYG